MLEILSFGFGVRKKASLVSVSCLLLYITALFLPQKNHPRATPALPSDPSVVLTQGSRLGVQGLELVLAPSGPSTVSWFVLKSGHFMF